MYKRILLALDLEGVNNVEGEAYTGLGRDSEQWNVARGQAVLEINAAAEALFNAGAESVGLWDNHGGGKNVDASLLDKRIVLHEHANSLPRMSFADKLYDCICYFGYHAMEGTLGGVLAHTMSSKEVQFYKLNGKYIGEVDIDSYISASHGMPSCFFAGGNIACRQAERAIGGIVTVITKEEISRNKAIFRDNEELLKEIKIKIVEAVSEEKEVKNIAFPAVVEKSFKRMEDAAKYISKLRSFGMNSEYPDDEILGKDAHTVATTVNSIDEFIKCI